MSIVLLLEGAALIGLGFYYFKTNKKYTYAKKLISEAHELARQAECMQIKKAEQIKMYQEQFDDIVEEIQLLRRERDDIICKKNIATEDLLFFKKQLSEQKERELISYTKDIEREKDQIKNSIKAEIDLALDKKLSILGEIDNLKSTFSAIQAAQLREEEIKDNTTFYTLQIDPKDSVDIDIIRSIEYKIADPRPLRMLIWSTYYLKKSNDLSARVLGTSKVCGIYKITNLKTNQCYIGQARDVKERWRDHMKHGLGIDTPAGNKLYQSMVKNHLEDFSFELLEECESSLLNEKEKFYIELYDSYNYGFNSNKGVSK